MYRQTQLLFSEVSDQAEWGYWYWSTDNGDGLTYQSGQDVVVRALFESNGTLANSKDTKYRAIQDNWPVFGFAHDLGSVGSSTVSRLFSLGLTQEDAVQYAGPSGTVAVPSLWTSYFSNELDAVRI